MCNTAYEFAEIQCEIVIFPCDSPSVSLFG